MSDAHPSDPTSPSPESLLADWIVRQELGEAVDLDTLCRAHPFMAERLRQPREHFDDVEAAAYRP